MLYFIFHNLFKHLTHIQNRYNLIFCLSKKQGFFGTMEENEKETGKEQMLNLKRRITLGNQSAYL
jgi:hypothetical protein